MYVLVILGLEYSFYDFLLFFFFFLVSSIDGGFVFVLFGLIWIRRRIRKGRRERRFGFV